MTKRPLLTLEILRALLENADELERRKRSNMEAGTILRLICALQESGPEGRHRSSIIKEVIDGRRERGFEPTEKAEEYIQGRFQTYCVGASAYDRRGAKPELGLFNFAQGKGKGYWGLNIAAAENWLQSQEKKQS